VRFVIKVSAVISPSRRQTLAQGLGDPITGLYATNASAPLRKKAGIRQWYKFGLYSYCGYLNNTAGTCSNTTIANKYQPYDALLTDMSLNYSALTIFIINGTSSFESQTLATHTHSAYYLILIGTICAFLALVMCADFFISVGPTANNCASQWRCQAYASFSGVCVFCNRRNCVGFDSGLHLDICHQ
jgi:SUR7/PalI family